jgi:hypothetical protein
MGVHTDVNRPSPYSAHGDHYTTETTNVKTKVEAVIDASITNSSAAFSGAS